MIEDLKIAIVLSGGAGKGAYQFGFVQALKEVIPKQNIAMVYASSIGIVNGYAYVADKMEKGCDFWNNLNCRGFLGIRKNVRNNLFLNDMSNNLVTEDDTLWTKFYVTECALANFSVYYWPINDMPYLDKLKLMQLGLSFPFMFKFGKFKNKYYSDGGIIDNIPIYPLRYNLAEYDVALVLHCDPKFKPNYELFDKVKLIMDFVVNINSPRKRESFDFSNKVVRQNIENGYNYGIKILNQLFADNVKSIEEMREVFQKIYFDEIPKRQVKRAAGTLVTMLNNVYWKTYFDSM